MTISFAQTKVEIRGTVFDDETNEIEGLVNIEIKPKYRKGGYGRKIIQDIKDTTKTGFNSYINVIFSQSSKGSITLLTAHKSKGLESPRVFIFEKSFFPSIFAKSKVEVDQESNLLYVSYTRAKNTLGFISDFHYSKRDIYLRKED